MKKATIAAIAATLLLFTSSMASAQVCVLGIFAAGIYASVHDHRELTTKEAWSCGLLYGTDAPKPKVKKIVHRRHKPKH